MDEKYLEFRSAGVMRQQGCADQVTLNDAGMACVVVDGVPAAEVRAALLRSRRCALRARQVLILEEFLIMGTHVQSG